MQTVSEQPQVLTFTPPAVSTAAPPPYPHRAKPLSWVVRLQVAPMWAQDGFYLDSDRVLDMLSTELSCAPLHDLEAEVLESPSTEDILELQGWKHSNQDYSAVRERVAAAHGKNTGAVSGALLAAENLLNSVAFVQTEGDTEPVLKMIRQALKTLAPRQGASVKIESA